MPLTDHQKDDKPSLVTLLFYLIKTSLLQESLLFDKILPLRVSTGSPVHFRVWYILQIGVNGLPGEYPTINSIFRSHNDMCTLLEVSMERKSFS